MLIVHAYLTSFGIIRFIEIGTVYKSLYIISGVSLVTGMTLEQLDSVKRVRKRLYQRLDM